MRYEIRQSYRFEFCVTTVSKLFTPTVPSGAEGRLNQLTSGIAATSGATLGKLFICVSSPSTQLSSLIGYRLATAGVMAEDTTSVE